MRIKCDNIVVVEVRNIWLLSAIYNIFIHMTDSIVRKHLKQITHILGWEHLQVSFHTFRRPGASRAIQLGVPIDAMKIRVQGPWNV